MTGGVELVRLRLYFHCGWAIQVDPSFEAEVLDGGRTLRMYDDGERREVSLSSSKIERSGGGPVAAEEALERLFPRELAGLRYEHRREGFAGSALWMLGDSDDEPHPRWVLMTLMICPAKNKMAQCTIVCVDVADREWALDTWRTLHIAEGPSSVSSAPKSPR